MAPGEESHLQFETIRIGADGLAEMDGTRPRLLIPRDQIVRVELERGSGAERPVVSLVLGLVLLVIAVLPVIMLINAFRGAGRFPDKLLAATAFVIPAIWLLDLTFRPRWFLRVHIRRGSRKLLFPRRAEQSAVEGFMSAARSRFGY